MSLWAYCVVCGFLDNPNHGGIFCAPKNAELFKKWENALSIVPRKFTKNSKVCRKHFKEDEVELYFERNLVDGKVWRYKRERPYLRRGAVPSIFTDIPKKGKSLASSKEITKEKNNEENIEKSKDLLKIPPGKYRVILNPSVTSLKSANEDGVTNSTDGDQGTNIADEDQVMNYTAGDQVTNSTDGDQVMNSTDGDQVMNSKDGDQVMNSIDGDQVMNSKDGDQATNSVGRNVTNSADNSATDRLQSLNKRVMKGYRVIIPHPTTDRLQYVKQDLMTFNYLKRHIHEIEVATPWWIVHAFESYIVCTRWNLDCDIDRKIVIKDDLSIRVYLGHNKEANLYAEKVKSIESISKLIRFLERETLCWSKENQNHLNTDEVVKISSGKNTIEVPKSVLCQAMGNLIPVHQETPSVEPSISSQESPDSVLKLASDQNQEVVIKDLNEVGDILNALCKGKYDSVIKPQEVMMSQTYSKNSTADSVIKSQVMPPQTNSKNSTTDSVIRPQVIPPLTSSKASNIDSVIVITSPSPNNSYTVTGVLTETQFYYRALKENIYRLQKKASPWSFSSSDNSIVCARWDSNNEVDRKIVVKSDLTFKVFVENKEIQIGTDVKMNKVENISELINWIQPQIVCSMFHENGGKCDCFIQQYPSCKRRKLCLSCLESERGQKKTEKKRLRKEKREQSKEGRKRLKKEAEELVELLRFEFNF